MQVFRILLLANLFFVHGFLPVSCEIDFVEFEKFVPPTGSWGRQPIILEKDGGFTNILVAIHRDVEESPSIIEGIKEIFTMMSRLLYSRTGETLYIRNVSILIPDNWEEPPKYERAHPNETFQTARIVIRDETSEALPPYCPFVRQLGGSGSEAEYMYLPSGMLTSRNESLKNESAEVILDLWGRLLCGLKETDSRGSEQSLLSIASCEHLWKDTIKNSIEVKDHQRDVNTTFRILQHSDILSVIILDDRENMKENNKSGRMKEAFEKYVWNLLPAYSRVGVVVVNDTCLQIVNLLKLWERPVFRLAVCRLFHSSFTYSTASLGEAVLKAQEMFSSVRNNTSGSFVFIMSDGTNISHALNKSIQKVTQDGVVVASLPFSADTSENIALGNTINPNFTMEDTNRLHRLEDETRFVRHLQSNEQLQPFEWISFNFSMDDTNMDSVLVRVRVTDPNNRRYLHFKYYNETDLPNPLPDFPRTRTDNLDMAVMEISIEETHIRSLEMKSNISQNVSLEVFSATLSPYNFNAYINEPIDIRTSVISKVINFTTSNGSIPLYVSLTQNGNPVLRVSRVTAMINNPDGVTSMVQLKDNGLGADLQSQDGIASNFFNICTTEGEYEVKINVYGGEETCVSNAFNEMCYPVDSNTSACSLLAPFQRVPPAISFTVTGIPPSKVDDLQAEINTSRRSVILSWTCVGEDLMIGRADHYEIRNGENESDITQNFESATVLRNFSDCDKCQEERISLEVNFSNADGAMFFLAIRAVDRRGNKGGVSNVVLVEFEEESSSFIKEVFEDWKIIFIAVTSVVIIVCVIVGILVYARVKYLLKNRVLPLALLQSNQDATSGGLTLVHI